MARLLNYIKQLFLKLKFLIWKTMNSPLTFYNESGSTVEIEADDIIRMLTGNFQVKTYDEDQNPIEYQEVIIVVTKYSADTFLATAPNKKSALKFQTKPPKSTM